MSPLNMVPVHVAASDAPVYALGDHSGALLLDAARTGGQFAFGVVEAEYNGGTPLHVHEREDEAFLILRGRFEMTVGGDVTVAEVGDAVFAPRDIAHAWKCVSPEGGAFLGVIVPGGFEQALAEVSAILGLGTPDALAQIGEAFARYGVTFVRNPGPVEKIGLLEPVVYRAGSGRVIDFGDNSARLLLSAAQTGGRFTLMELRADYEGGIPSHVHTREDETFYILEGQFSFIAGGKLMLAGPGDCVFGPRNVIHSWRCISPQGGRAVLVATPGGFENFLAEMEAVFPPTPETMPAMFAVAERHGLTMLPPEA
jgi:quercetin dioxygenase-like cupin family protein